MPRMIVPTDCAHSTPQYLMTPHLTSRVAVLDRSGALVQECVCQGHADLFLFCLLAI